MNIRKPYYREFRRRFYETLGDKGDSILRYRGADNKEHYIASGNSPDVKPGGGMVETTWQELKDKRDAGKLIPGSLYRITDYQCTTTQENTRSAGHQFDIVLLALSENKLAEEGWAMMHENIYDVKFSDGRKKCYIAKDTYYSEEDEGEVRNIVDLETGLGVRAYVEYLEIDEENKKANYPFNIICLSVEDLQYNYFQNSNLSAWKVWYCLDNDKSRFAWADNTYKLNPASIICDCYRRETKVDGPIYLFGKQFVNGTIYYRDEENDTTIPHMGNMPVYAWTSENNITIFTESKSPNSFDSTYAYNTGGTLASISGGAYGDTYNVTSYIEGLPNYDFPNGRGVIYRLIDEWGNDVPYDFKNIQFVRKLTDGAYDPDSGEDTWVHTFTWLGEDGVALDASVVAQNITNGQGGCTGCHDNVIGACSAYGMGIKGNTFVFALNDIVFISAYSYRDGIYYGCYGNKFGADCHSNTFGNDCGNNTFKNFCTDSTFGDGCNGNTFGNNCISNTFGNSCIYNTFGNGCTYNTFGNYCAYNTFRYGCGNNTFGNSYAYNTFGNGCTYNTFGNDCGGNTFGDGCSNNTFKNFCTDSTFGDGCNGNTFGNNCQFNTFGNNCISNTFGNYCSANTFGNSCQFSTFGNNCGKNTFGNGCSRNSFGNNAEKCSVGDGVQNITVSKDFIRYVIIENGNQKITITSNKTTSSSAYLQNFLIALGVNNSNTAKTISHNSVNDAFRTVYQNENSTSVNV